MFNFKRSLLASSIALALSQAVVVDAAVVTGSIEDNQGTLPGAKIEVVGQQYKVESDNEGNFIIRDINPGEYTLKVSYLGYTDKTLTITVEDKSNALGVIKVNEKGDIEEVVTVGSIVRGEMRALNKKMNANRIMDVISSDGIGKLPDRNAAEAVQRVPGVSIERDQGEGRFVAVRGLPTQWNSSTINGSRIPAAEEETTTRATAFDFFPTELIDMVEVNKALTADIEGDAIGGNINFITKIAPKDRVLKLGAGVNYNQKADGYGHNWNVLYGDRYLDNKLGYIVNVTGWQRDWGTDNFETRRDDAGIKRLELRDYNGHRATYGINTGIEYDFDNGDKIYGRAMFGTLADTETHYKHRYRFDKQSIDENGNLSGGRVEIQHIYNQLNTEMFGGDIGGKHNFSDKTQFNWNLAHYQNRFYYGDIPNSDDKAYFVAKFTQKNVLFEDLDNVDGKFRANNKIDGGTDPYNAISTHLPSDFEYDPSQMKIADFNLYKVDISEKDNIVLRFDLIHDVDSQLKVSSGIKFREKERHARFSDEFYTWNNESGGDTPTLDQFPLSDQPGRDDFLNEIDIDYDESLSKVGNVKDMKTFWNDNREHFTLETGKDYSALIENGGAIGRNFDLNETQSAIYGMADYRVDDQLSLNVGLRLEHTITRLTGFNHTEVKNDDGSRTNSVSVVKDSMSYLSWLPSLHVKYALDDLQNIRFALTRSFARPDFGDISPGASYSEHDEELLGGNTALKPTYSNNIDLIWSKYFDDVGIISAGVFYKYIQDPIFKKTSKVIYANQNVDYIRPENGFNSWLAGAELTVDHRFGFITPALEDVGMRFNYTYTDSAMTIPGRKDKVSIPRQADNLANLMFYYDNSIFAARVAMNYKDKYIIEHDGADKNSDVYYGKYMSLDFSAQYQAMDNMLVYFEANNLNNEPLTYFTGDEKRPNQTEYYGPRFQLGVTYDIF